MNKLANLMDRDKRALEKLGVPAATNVGQVMAMRLKLACEDNPTPEKISAIVREYMAHMEPILLDAMVAGNLAGRARIMRLASKAIAKKKYHLGAFDSAIKVFQAFLGTARTAVQSLTKGFALKAAKVTKSAADMVEKKARKAIEESIRLGEHVKDAQERLKDALDEAGVDEASPFLCETICRTTIAASYSAGAQAALADPDIAEFHDGFQYATVGDDRVSDICQEFDGFIGPKTNEFWQTHTPPLHYNCRCSLIPLFSEFEPNIPETYGDAAEGDNPVTGLPWGEQPDSDE